MSSSLDPVHPGEILSDQLMPNFDLDVESLAKALGVKQSQLESLIKGEISIDDDWADRLGNYFNTSEEFWHNIQKFYDDETAQLQNDTSGEFKIFVVGKNVYSLSDQLESRTEHLMLQLKSKVLLS